MDKGAEAEARAAEYLRAHGLRLVARNWRARGGEIDLIMRDGATLVFVEVRARAASSFGGAASSITASKRARLIHAAKLYLAGLTHVPACRFDVVTEDAGVIGWLRDAFQVAE
jgi:putative endonuclease